MQTKTGFACPKTSEKGTLYEQFDPCEVPCKIF